MPRLLSLIWQAILKLLGSQASVDKRLADLQAGQESLRASLAKLQMETARDLTRMADILGLLLEAVTPDPPVAIQFTAVFEDGAVQENITMLEMSYTQKATLTLKAVDKKGNPAALDGKPEWLSGNTDLVQIENISSDGMSADAVAMGALGTTTITVTGDAKLGPDVSPIIGGLDVRITPGEAQQITVTAGAPVEQEA